MNSEEIVENLNDLTEDIFLVDEVFYENILARIGRKVGHGAVGDVFTIDNVLVKIDRPCEKYSKDIRTIRKINCDEVRNEEFVYYMPHGFKKLVQINNTLVEGVIGSVLNKYRDETTLVPRVYGVRYSKFNLSSFMFIEKLKDNLDDIVYKNGKISWTNIVLIVFQVAYGLYVLQSEAKFTHYDLHTRNLVYEDNKKNRGYFIGKNKVNMRPPFNVKMIDFGHSRLEHDNVIVNHTQYIVPNLTYGTFDQHYDFAMFISSLILRYNLDTHKTRYLYNLMLKQPLKINDVIDKYYDKHVNGIYVLKNEIRNYSNDFVSMEEVCFRLLEELDGKIDYNVEYAKRKYKVPQYIIEPIKLNRTILNTPQYAFGIPLGNIRVPVKYITYTTRNRMMRSTCCKINTMDIFKGQKGIMINGGFFDLGKTWNPIGQYRQLNNFYESNYPIPEKYEQYYGWISIHNGVLDIHENMPQGISTLFRSAPILVMNSEETSFVRMLKDNTNEVNTLFNCANPNKKESGKNVIMGTANNNNRIPMKACNKITPGTLYHAMQRNPRSVLLIGNKNGVNMADFIHIKGRERGYEGLTLLETYEFLKSYIRKFDAGTVKAINLDGGMSSNITCFEGERILSTTRQISPSVGNAIYKLFPP